MPNGLKRLLYEPNPLIWFVLGSIAGWLMVLAYYLAR